MEKNTSLEVEERFRRLFVEQKTLKKKLKEFNERYALITENVNDFIAVLDKNLKFEYINEEFHRKHLGYSKDKLIGTASYNLIHPEDIERVLEYYKKASRKGEGKIEFRIRHANGHYIWVEVKGKRFIDVNNKLKTLLISREITERKGMEKKLKESEEMYRLISENANDLIRVLNERFEFEYINENVHKRLLGYSIKDLRGKTHLPFLHPEDRRHAIRSTVKNLKKGEGSYQARFKDKDGNYKWYEFAGKIFHNSIGEKKILSIARDINQRKIAELKLKESEEKYRLISETAYDLILVVNKRFKYEYINENAFRQILGYTNKDLLGKSVLKYVHPDDLSKTTLKLLEGFKQGSGESEFRIKHKGGHWVWFEGKGKTFMDSDEELKAIVISRDITQRKIAEEKLRQSEERYRLISQNADENLFIFDMNLNLIYNDTRVPNILGYSYEEMRNLSLMDYNVPSSLKIALNAYKEELRNERRKLKDLNRIRIFEVEQVHKNGSIIDVEIRFTFLRDDNGKAKGILGLSRNITKRKQAEKNLKESEEKYRKAYNRAQFYKDLFVHDMSNILAVINSSAELIPYYCGESEQSKNIKSITEIIRNQIDRGAKLVSNVHILSELEEHLEPLEAIMINSLLNNSIEFIKNSFKDREIKIQLDCNGVNLKVNANQLLREVFDNILINSIKYNENYSVEVLIKTSLETLPQGKFVKIEFIDNGIGIPDDRKEMIFKPGNRELKGSKGMGIGLSLVKKIIKGYNGKIWIEDKVENDYTKGSNFIIMIPIANQKSKNK
ncbi:MAG: PAS domain S-box protein [Promethearchaeota archaeon]